MVKLRVKFKKDQGGLSGKIDVSEFRSVAEAKKHKEFLKGTYEEAEIITRKKKPQQKVMYIGNQRVG
jgi:hypothetical protein